MIKLGDGTIIRLSEINYAYIEEGSIYSCMQKIDYIHMKISFCNGKSLRILFDTRLEADKELDKLMIAIKEK